MSFQAISNEQAIETQPVVPAKRGKYFAGIIVCIVLLYVFNNLLSLYLLSVPEGSNIIKAIIDSAYTQLKIPFLADSFISCLWAINLALGLGIMGNFALLFYRPRWFFFLLQAVLIAVGILPVYLVHKIFPFVIDSPDIQTVVKTGLIAFRILLGVVVIFMLIKSAINFVHTIRNFERL
jgi:hypothetical protein